MCVLQCNHAGLALCFWRSISCAGNFLIESAVAGHSEFQFVFFVTTPLLVAYHACVVVVCCTSGGNRCRDLAAYLSRPFKKQRAGHLDFNSGSPTPLYARYGLRTHKLKIARQSSIWMLALGLALAVFYGMVPAFVERSCTDPVMMLTIAQSKVSTPLVQWAWTCFNCGALSLHGMIMLQFHWRNPRAHAERIHHLICMTVTLQFEGQGMRQCVRTWCENFALRGHYAPHKRWSCVRRSALHAILHIPLFFVVAIPSSCYVIANNVIAPPHSVVCSYSCIRFHEAQICCKRFFQIRSSYR